MRGSSRWRVSAFLLTFSTRRKKLRSLRVEMPDEELKEDCTPEVTCTSGTQVKYKVIFANQAVAKETRLQGVGMSY